MTAIDASAPPTAANKRPKRWSLTGCLLLAAWAGLCIYMTVPVLLWSPVYREMTLHPMKPAEDQYTAMDSVVALPHQEFFFTNNNGDRLHAFFWRTPGAKDVIVFHHGNAGNLAYRTEIIAALCKLGASVFIYDYRGFGKSGGDASLQGSMDDGMIAYDFVRDKLTISDKHIINYGESLGAGPACAVALKRPCGALILQSGISSLPSVGKWHFGFLRPYPDFLIPGPHMDNLTAVQNIHCPVFIIHGAKDQVIPIQLAQKVFANANQPKYMYVMQDSSHNAVTSMNDLKKFSTAIRQAVSAADG